MQHHDHPTTGDPMWDHFQQLGGEAVDPTLEPTLDPTGHPTTILPSTPNWSAPTASSPVAGPTDHRPRMGRGLAAGIASAAVLLGACVAGGLAVGGESATEAAPVATDSTGRPIGGGPIDVSTALSDEIENEHDLSDDSTGFPDQGPPPLPAQVDTVADPAPDTDDGSSGGEAVDLSPDPQNTSEPEPCVSGLAPGASLAVLLDPIALDAGVFDGSVTLLNCSDGDVEWTAASKPTVTLSSPTGTVLPGESFEVPFSIDDSAYGPGAIDLKIKVSEPGHNHYVDVHAFQPVVGSDLAIEPTFTNGEGSCAQNCIRTARLIPNFQNTNVGFRMTTSIPTTMAVKLSQHPVVMDGDVPTLPGVSPTATSADGVEEWSTVFENLEAGAEYSLVISATDHRGATSYAHHTFTAPTPIGDQGGSFGTVDRGCADQCIRTALVEPGADHTVQQLTVATNEAARIGVHVGTTEIQYDGETPNVGDEMLYESNGIDYVEDWATTLTGLTGDTTYWVVVEATDEHGATSYVTGSFHTAPAPVRTNPEPETFVVSTMIHRIEVTHDGDSGSNKGELSFAWGMAGQLVGSIAERKIGDGGSVEFDMWEDQYMEFGLEQDDFVPPAWVNAFERDSDGLNEFCTMFAGYASDPGRNADCDLTWNVAGTGLMTPGSISNLSTCAELAPGLVEASLATRRCTWIESVELGNDFPRFRALVSYGVSAF